MNNFFKVLHQSTKSKARLGTITTDHGVIKTPSFVAVGTKGTIKSLAPSLVQQVGTQVAFVNTYHLVTHPGAGIIEAAGGIHQYSRLEMPLMSDSGGFQVFSLASPKRQFAAKAGLAYNQNPPSLKLRRAEEEPLVIKISEDGVQFRSTYDGALIEFTPEKSMEFQRQIGADINMAFDECTYYPATHEYAERAMNRTHEWLKRCIKFKSLKVQKLKSKNLQTLKPSNIKTNQYLYGVIQGGTFEDLRKKSAEFIVSQNISGVAIGGVSVGETKQEMRDQVAWVSPFLPSDKPVHLLGVGQIDDIIDLVGSGVDTFDCVEPTRLARMGILYEIFNFQFSIFNEKSKIKNEKSGEIDITKSVYKNDFGPIVSNCQCYTCLNFTRSYLHHLFKQREILGYTLTTFHNLWVMEKLFEKIRNMIGDDRI